MRQRAVRLGEPEGSGGLFLSSHFTLQLCLLQMEETEVQGLLGAPSTRKGLGVSLTLGVPRFALLNTFWFCYKDALPLYLVFSQGRAFPWEDQGSL